MVTGNTGRYNHTASSQSAHHGAVRIIRNSYGTNLRSYPGEIYYGDEDADFEEGYQPGYENTFSAAKGEKDYDDIEEGDENELEEEDGYDEDEEDEEDNIPERSQNSNED